MVGTTTEETLEIDLIPPMMMIRERIVRTIPDITVETPKVLLTAEAMELA
jgi:hypothetical protein